MAERTRVLISAANCRRMVELATGGMSNKAIGALFGISDRAVEWRLRQKGIRTDRRRVFTPDEDAMLAEWRRQGLRRAALFQAYRERFPDIPRSVATIGFRARRLVPDAGRRTLLRREVQARLRQGDRLVHNQAAGAWFLDPSGGDVGERLARNLLADPAVALQPAGDQLPGLPEGLTQSWVYPDAAAPEGAG